MAGSYLANKKILVPFDFSEQAARAVSEAAAMADPSTRICLVHVLMPAHVISLEPGMLVDLGADATRIATAVEAMQKRFANLHEGTEFLARIGDPGMEIAACAEEIGADLIVMPSQGRTGVTRLLLGSVAERVVRLAHCPVMVLRG